MKFLPKGGGDRNMHVDITPMIDVVFLLIIFFMTTAQFASMTRADIDLPVERGEQEEVSEEAGLVINILADGQIIIDQEALSFEDLEQEVAGRIRRSEGASSRGFKLLIRADRGASTGRMNQVLSMLQRMGVGGARLGTEVPN